MHGYSVHRGGKAGNEEDVDLQVVCHVDEYQPQLRLHVPRPIPRQLVSTRLDTFVLELDVRSVSI